MKIYRLAILVLNNWPRHVWTHMGKMLTSYDWRWMQTLQKCQSCYTSTFYQGCQMVYFHTKNAFFAFGFKSVMYFMAIRYLYCNLGIFYIHLAFLWPFGEKFILVGLLHQYKSDNPAFYICTDACNLVKLLTSTWGRLGGRSGSAIREVSQKVLCKLRRDTDNWNKKQ
jgi:hypothetical protein